MIFRSEFHFYNFIPAIICIAGVVIQNISKHTHNEERFGSVGFLLAIIGFCLSFVLC